MGYVAHLPRRRRISEALLGWGSESIGGDPGGVQRCEVVCGFSVWGCGAGVWEFDAGVWGELDGEFASVSYDVRL